MSVAVAVIPTVTGMASGALNMVTLGQRPVTIPMWCIVALVVVVVAIGVCMTVDNVVHRATMFKPLEFSQRERIVFMTRLPVGAYALWSVLFLSTPGQWLLWAGLLIGIALATYLGCMGQEYVLNRPTAPKPIIEKIEEPTESKVEVDFKSALARAGHPKVRIVSHTTVVENGEFIADQFRVQTPANGR